MLFTGTTCYVLKKHILTIQYQMMKNTFQASGTVLARADHLSNTKQGGACCLYYIYFIFDRGCSLSRYSN